MRRVRSRLLRCQSISGGADGRQGAPTRLDLVGVQPKFGRVSTDHPEITRFGNKAGFAATTEQTGDALDSIAEEKTIYTNSTDHDHCN